MKALILAAGEGTRMRPLTIDRPKPMLPIGGRPLLEHLVGLVVAHGIRDIAINLHHRPEAIIDHFGDGAAFGVRITYSREPMLFGSAGAARHLAWFLDGTFLVLCGDLLTDANLTALVDAHRSLGGVGTIGLCEADDPTGCGIVRLDPAGRIARFVEKPPTDALGRLASCGIYVLEPAVLDRVPVDRPYDFGADLFPDLVAAGLPLFGWRVDGYVMDIGSPERYRRAEADVRAERVRTHAARTELVAEGDRC